MLIDLLNLLKC